ncbi:MAG: threonine synthase [Bacteroidales bacterium]|nr:threonine synthase [Bacteroidales bacterium]
MVQDRLFFHSTNLRSPETSFREALLNGLAPDGGLYMPSAIPVFKAGELEVFSSKEYHEIASSVLEKYTGNEIEPMHLKAMCEDAYDFEIPIERVYDRYYIMRLDRGPTASFKDFAARMMGRMMQYFLAGDERNLTILTATSGDTGSAVANAFHGLDNIRVIILFPAEEVTSLQRKQMTTLRDNVRVIAVNGKFDDCQQLVKNAFTDPVLEDLNLSSANSINIGRLLPQIVYYFYAWSRVSGKQDDPVVFSVPSGNFGNLMGGLLAWKMGLPVRRFVVATNSNDEVPVYLETGIYRKISPSKDCISSAMNVGHPGNLPRMVSLYGGVMDEAGVITRAPDLKKMREDIFAVSVSETETRETIRLCHSQSGLLLEPHGAVAWKGLQKYLHHCTLPGDESRVCIALETAHPAKFHEEISKLLGVTPPFPESLSKVEGRKEDFLPFENNYANFRDFLRKNYK